MAPIISRVSTASDWLNSEFKFLNIASPQMKQITDLVQGKYTNSTMVELIYPYLKAKLTRPSSTSYSSTLLPIGQCPIVQKKQFSSISISNILIKWSNIL